MLRSRLYLLPFLLALVSADRAIGGGGTPADLSITKTDGVEVAVAGGSVTYTIVASNAGPGNSFGPVTDFFPDACLSVSWTCVGAGGGICTSSGTGDLIDFTVLPAGASLTYTATCNLSPTATGTLVNSAQVVGPLAFPDPQANNFATDTDVIVVPGEETEVPALGPVGGVVLASALGALALGRLGRRRGARKMSGGSDL